MRQKLQILEDMRQSSSNICDITVAINSLGNNLSDKPPLGLACIFNSKNSASAMVDS